jgi:hypothetical protein
MTGTDANLDALFDELELAIGGEFQRDSSRAAHKGADNTIYSGTGSVCVPNALKWRNANTIRLPEAELYDKEYLPLGSY